MMPTPTLHVFQRSPEPDLYCAVSETRAIPAFVRGNSWRYAGRMLGPDLASLGAPDGKAAEAVERLGFYIFHSVQRITARKI
jgi:hypothetical protein